MQSYATQIAHYLMEYRQGDAESAFHSLREMDPASLPELIASFRSESDADTQAFLLNVIWQRRDRSTIPFLAETLFDPQPKIWKEALDGLVTLGSPEAFVALQAARTRQFSSQRDTDEFHAWLDEAIGQVGDQAARI